MALVVKDYNPCMPLRAPELQLRYDENSIPVSAKCSMCGEQMPQSTPRITNSIDNVAWFAAQFGLHIAQIHPPNAPKVSPFGNTTYLMSVGISKKSVRL